MTNALADRWIRAIEAIIIHAAEPGASGHTHSGLPLLSVTQEDIDHIEADENVAPGVEEILPLPPWAATRDATEEQIADAVGTCSARNATRAPTPTNGGCSTSR